MNDHTPDPHDDLLRQALRAEADDVVADEALRQRVEAATADGRPSWTVRLIAVAAAIALLGGAAIFLTQSDDGQEVDAIDPATPTTTSGEPAGLAETVAQLFECSGSTMQLVVVTAPDASATDQAAVESAMLPTEVGDTLTEHTPEEVLQLLEAEGMQISGDAPAAWVATYVDPDAELAVRSVVADLPGVLATSSTDCRGGDGTPSQPEVVVAVTGAGRLVVLDVATGAELQELAAYDDPNAVDPETPEVGPYSISGVALHPNGRDVYFETCCEPAAGAVFRVPIDGSAEPEPVVNAYGIDISADGRWLVGTTGAGILLHDLEAGSSTDLLGNDDDFLITAERVAINADGTEITVVSVERTAEGTVISASRARYPIVDGRLGEPTSMGESDGRIFPLYSADQERPGLAMGQGADLAVDASGQWLLEVDAQGALAVRTTDGPVVLSPGPFIAADW